MTAFSSGDVETSMPRSMLKVLILTILPIASLAAFLALALIPRPPVLPPADFSTALPPAPLPPAPMVQAMHGYTLTVQPLFADANRIVFSATIGLPPDQARYRFGAWAQAPQLTDDRGTAFSWVPTNDWRYNDQSPGWDSHHPTTFSIVFTMPDLPETPALNLHLVAPVWGAAGDARSPHFREGPFIFDFQMPVDPARRVTEVNQTVVGAGGIITLDRVVATRHETRALLHFQPRDDAGVLFDESPSLVLQAGDWSSLQHPDVGAGIEQAGNTISWSVFTSLLTTRNPWTLTVNEIWRTHTSRFLLAESTVFHFTLPPRGAAPLVYTPVRRLAPLTPSPLPIPLPTAPLPLPLPTGLTLPAPPPSYPAPMPVHPTASP